MMKRHLIACVKKGKIGFVVDKLFRELELKVQLRDEFHIVIRVSSTLERSGKARMTGVITWEMQQIIISQEELTILKVIDGLPENVWSTEY